MGLFLGSCDQPVTTAGLDPDPEGPPVMALSKSSAEFGALTHALAPMQIIAIGNAGPGILGGLGIGKVEYFGDGAGWLTASLSGTAAPTTLMLQAAAGNLAAGTYYASLTLVATGAANSPRTIDLSLRVEPTAVGPIIGMTATAASFGVVTGTPGVTQQVQILPANDAPLTGLAIVDVTYEPGTPGWLAARLDGTLAPANLLLTPDATSLSPGTYAAVVSIGAPGAINSPRTVRVTLTVTSAPVPASLRLSTTALAASGEARSVAITNGGGGTLDGLRIGTISYAGGAGNWLTAALSATSAPSTLTLTPTVAGLPAGVYTAVVPVSASNVTGSQSVTFTLTVTGVAIPAALSLTPGSVGFAGTLGGAAPAPQTVSITNAGGGTLTGISIGPTMYTGAAGWLQTTLTATTAPATLTLTPIVSALAAGTYTATVPVGAIGASNAPQYVTVTLVLSPPGTAPLIALTPSAVSFATTLGGAAPAAKTVSVGNAGTGSLAGLSVGAITYSGGGSGWITASLNSTTAPATLTVAPSPGALPAGTYSATVPISASGAGNAPQSLSVTLTIAAGTPPTIGLSPASLAFSATAGGASPAAKTAAVSNTGGGALTGLAVGTIAYGPGASGWVSASLNTSTAPATLTVAPTLGAIAAGTYTATVPVAAGGASNSPVSVSVTLTVSPSAGVSFTTDIYPTLQASCATSGCHVPGKQKPDLSSRTTGYAALVTNSTKYVTPGNPNTGLLVGTMQGTNGPLMPPSGKLPQSFIDKVRSWIQSGAPNN